MTLPDGSPLLEVAGIGVRFGGIVALDGISFSVARGQICGLIGPNGAGKTTLFNCLSRLYRVDRGSILFEGRPLLAAARHEIANLGIARTFQNLALFGTMSVLENVMVGAHGRGRGGFIADALGIKRVVVPPVAALYSAFGMFAMDIGQDYARSFVGRTNNIDLDTINRVYAELEAEAQTAFKQHGVSPDKVILKRSADLRYIGQFHEVEVDMAGGKITREGVDATAAGFTRKHEELYTFAMPWKAVEILTLRLKATTPNAPFALPQVAKGDADPKPALKRRRTCRFNGRDVDTPIYDGEKVLAGNVISGPAIIEETTTTVVIPAAYVCSVDKYKNYILTRS